MAEKYIYVHTVAKKLNCSTRYVYRLIQEGEIEAVRIGSRALRIPESSLEGFLRSRQVHTWEKDGTH